MKEFLRQLMESLEAVGQVHEELYDTVVRENMFDAVFNGFVDPKENFELPDDLGLYDPEANRRVGAALGRYIRDATAKAAELGLDTPAARLAAFQDSEVYTEEEEQYPDDFFGWMDPSALNTDERG